MPGSRRGSPRLGPAFALDAGIQQVHDDEKGSVRIAGSPSQAQISVRLGRRHLADGRVREAQAAKLFLLPLRDHQRDGGRGGGGRAAIVRRLGDVDGVLTRRAVGGESEGISIGT